MAGQHRRAQKPWGSTWPGWSRFCRGVVLVGILVVTGCTAAPAPWVPVPLPGRVQPVTLTGVRDGVLVGGYAPDPPNPWLAQVQVAGDGRTPVFTPVHLDAGPGYADQARFDAIATDAGRIAAVGGARGGAHDNVRWSAWTGDITGVDERAQPFETFGGWGAGDLVGIAYVNGQPAIVGSWQSAQTGLDVAVWRMDGNRFTRLDSTGTALASTPRELAQPTWATSRPGGLVITGSVTMLDGSTRVRPVVWVAATAAGPWARIELPATGTQAQSDAATCVPAGCLIVGQANGHLTGWWLTPQGVATGWALPPLQIPDRAAVRPPVLDGQTATVVAPSASGSMVLTGWAGDWTPAAGPTGTPVAVAAGAGRIYIATSTGLWSRPL